MRVFNKNRFSFDLKRKIKRSGYTLREIEYITGIGKSTLSRACNQKNIEIESFANLLLFINEDAEYYFDNYNKEI